VRGWEGVRLVGKMGERREKNDLNAGLDGPKNRVRSNVQRYVRPYSCRCVCV
jgi:hypothetical protein